MKLPRSIGRLLLLSSIAASSACAAPVPNALVSASHETIVTALPASGGPTPNSQQQMLDLARQFVFRVRNTNCDVLGTSFLVNGSILTNRHVAAGASSLELSTWAGEDFTSSVVGHSGDFDLARLRPSVPSDVTPASIDPTDPLVGQLVYVAGYPQGNQLTISTGDVLATIPGARVDISGQALVVSDQVMPGNSGSPLLDPEGHVVGVVFAQEVKTHYGIVIPVSSLLSFLHGKVTASRLPCTSSPIIQPSG